MSASDAAPDILVGICAVRSIARPALTVAAIAVVAVAAYALPGCGSAGSGASTPSPSPIRLSSGDAGRSVTVRRGTLIDVSLPPLDGFRPWSAPVAGDQKVLKPVTRTPHPPEGGTATASFRAGADGTSRITSTARIACTPTPGRVCPMVVRSWTVTVHVTG